MQIRVSQKNFEESQVYVRVEMAEGMDVDPAPVVRDKKRFEVKKVTKLFLCLFLTIHLVLF